MSRLPGIVDIRDDTMREGLQIESQNIPVSQKLRLLDALGETGATIISIGSYAHPKWTPQMACIDEIAEKFVPKPGITYTADVFNEVGFRRADKWYPKINVRKKQFTTVIQMSNTFAMRNFNTTQSRQIAAMDSVIEKARLAGASYGALSIGNPFGCNFEGEYTLEQRMKLLELIIERWHEQGFTVKKCAITDGMGWNMPDKVKEFLCCIQDKWPEITEFHCHFHNQRGVAMVSYYEALLLGAQRFDTCLGGMGGCPYCGNGRAASTVPTEDFVNLCEEMGVRTGYNLDRLIEAAAIAEEVVGHPLWGHVSKAGVRPRGSRLYPKNMPFVETLEEATHFRKGPGVYAHQKSPWNQGDPLLG